MHVETASGPETDDEAMSSKGPYGAVPRESRIDIRSVALSGLFILAVLYTTYFVRAILLPLVLAVILSYLLRPITRFLRRGGIPPLICVAIVLAGVLGVVGYGIFSVTTPAASWLEKAPYSFQQLERRLLPLRKPMQEMARASGEIEKLATPDSSSARTTVEVKRHPITDTLLLHTPEMASGAVLLFVLLFFLLAYDGVFLGKVIRVLPTLSDKKRAVFIATEIESQVSRYLFTQTVINVGLGIAVGIVLHVLGLPNPLMWGVMVALLNFVPYLGALTGIVCVTLGAILSFDSLGYALLFPAAYLALAALEGNLITPLVMGRSLTLNPVIILLSLVFWGWMWGIVGVILAVPLLAAFKIFCTHIPSMEPIAEFLS